MSNRSLAITLWPIATINRTRAELIKASVHADAKDFRRDPTRYDSIYAVFPKMVMGERNRHRGFSLSDRSSRAVPPEKLIEEIRSGFGLAMPAKFRGRARGMGGGDELAGDEPIEAQLDWIEDALNAADGAERAMLRGEEKETVNRRMDMYIYMHTLQSGTRDIWYNWFGLRLDSGASPTIILTAQKTFEVYKAAQPEPMEPGQWHTCFVNAEEYNYYDIQKVVSLSAARCAHLSFNDLETGKLMTVERALGIAAKLKELRHPSPFEHQATPDLYYGHGRRWENPNQWGNLYGWRQARKIFMPGEAVAPLPEGYEL